MANKVFRVPVDGELFDTVGEFAYRDALRRHFQPVPGAGPMVEQCTLELVLEPDNPYDHTAISVRRNDDVLSYLPAEVAADYFPVLASVAANGQLILASGNVWAKRSRSDGGMGVNLRVVLPSVKALASITGGRSKRPVKLPPTYQRKNPAYRRGLNEGADRAIVGAGVAPTSRSNIPANDFPEFVMATNKRDAKEILGGTPPASTFPISPSKGSNLSMKDPRAESFEKLFKPALGDRVASDELFFTLVTEPDNPQQSGAISVRLANEVMGYLPEDDARRYAPALNRIQASGQAVVVPGSLVASKWQGINGISLDMSVVLSMPEPEQLVPLNVGNVRGVVLPYGNSLQVVGEENHFDYLFNYVPPTGEGTLLLELRRGTQQLRGGETKDIAHVYLDGEEIGRLTPASGNHFIPTLRHLEDYDHTALVWGRIKGSALDASLTIQAAKAHEIPDTWLEEPQRVDYTLVPEDDHYVLPDAYVLTHEEWAEQKRRQAAERQEAERQAAERRAAERQAAEREAVRLANERQAAHLPQAPTYDTAQVAQAGRAKFSSSPRGTSTLPQNFPHQAPVAFSGSTAPPKKPGVFSRILMWFAFVVGATGIWVEPISGLIWLAIGFFTLRWRKKRRRKLQEYQRGYNGMPIRPGS